MLANFSLQCRLLAVWDNYRAHLSASLKQSHHGSFIFAAGSGDAALTLAHMHIAGLSTDETFIGLHFAAEFASKESVLYG